jgi:branched-chain amino acid transport system permease protein
MLQAVLNGIGTCAIYSLIAMAYQFLLLGNRFFDLSFAIAITTGGYSSFVAVEMHTWPPIAAVIIGVIVGGLFLCALEVALFSSLRRRGSPPPILLLSSFGILMAGIPGLSLLFGSQPRFVTSIQPPESIYVRPGVYTSALHLNMVAISILTVIILTILLKFTRWGLRFRALASQPELAPFVGIDISRMRRDISVLAGGIGSGAIALHMFDVGISPTVGFSNLLVAFVAVLIARRRGPLTTALAAFALGITFELLSWYMPGSWETVVLYVLLLALLLVSPLPSYRSAD